MIKPLSFFIIFLIICACAHQQKKYPTPDWAIQLRGGESSLMLEVSNKYLFRANYQDKDHHKEEVCRMALEMNKEYIKSSFPDIEFTKIPITVEILFYDEEVGDCSTTVSISKNRIEDLRKQMIEEKKQVELASQQEQKKQLEIEKLKKKQENKNDTFTFAEPKMKKVKKPLQDYCCRYCYKGQACGNSCISTYKECRKPSGCACNALKYQ